MSSAQYVWELSRAVLPDQDGSVVVLKVYMDESGVHKGSPIVAVGSYAARPSVWREFTKEWNKRKKPIKVFHASDSQNLENEFKGWCESDRDALVIRLLPALTMFDMVGMVIGIDLRAFEKAMKPYPEYRDFIGEPYTACFQWSIALLVDFQQRRRKAESLAFFHENNDYETDALKAFKYVKRTRNAPKISLTFGSKNDYVPLQTADVLAYEGNKRLRNLSTRPRRSWAALDPKHRIRVKMYGEANMPEMLSYLQNVYKHSQELSDESAKRLRKRS